MRAYLYRWLLPIGLATASLIGTVETASAQPNVRDHRRPGVNDGPREAPPPLREERVRPKGRGWTWVPGFWDWKGSRWEWTGGRWEKSRPGRRWRAHSWEQRNGVYIRVDGDWVDDRPSQAPPDPREERVASRRGFTWVPGHWDWENGQWQWVDGKYERERRGKRFRNARWELRDGSWIRVEGSWDEAPLYPTDAPPPPREERFTPRRGFVWVRGKYDWRNGNWEWVAGHWERERANQQWTDGRWELRNGRYEWIEGGWQAGGGGPSQPCPAEPTLDRPPPHAMKPETIRESPGKFEVKGRWNWDRRTCDYVWTSGYAESYRQGYRYVPGNWNQGNGKWYWVEPKWEPTGGGGSPPPPPPPTGGNPPPPPSGGPTQPPPSPRAENPGTKGGFVWIRGHYEWRGNQYEWINGHWERERARQRWVDGRWELRGGVYVWSPGNWQ